MAHPNWCGKPCAECREPCLLDLSISCSPDCPGLIPLTGEPNLKECTECDAIKSCS